MDDPSSILMSVSLVVLVMLSALFSGSETALFSISPAKVEMLKADRIKGAKLIAALKENPQKMLVIILLGNNLVNVLATAIATVLFTRLSGNAGIGVATGIMTITLLVFGEVLPKSLATKNPIRFAQFVVYPLLVLEYLAFPIIWIFQKVLRVLVGEHINEVSEEEVKAMVSMGAEDGTLEKHEEEFIVNVLEFNDMNAVEIMTPRTEIDAIEASATLEETIEFAIETSHSRIPVYRGRIDNIIGFITVKKMLEYAKDKSNLDKHVGELELFEFIKVPASRKTHSLLREFKKKRRHMALVFDEHGGIEGIVTLEDVLEEIVGDISDEDDEVETPIVDMKDGTLICEGDVELGDLRDKMKIEIAHYEDKDHINWLILDYLKRFPTLHEEVEIGNARFEIKEMDKESNKIEKVKVSLIGVG